MNRKKASLRNDWPLSRTLRISEIPPSDFHMRIDATPEERARLTSFTQVESIETFSVTLQLSRKGDAVYFTGEIFAQAHLVCVTSVDIFSWNLKESVSGVFIPIDLGEACEKENVWDKLSFNAETDAFKTEVSSGEAIIMGSPMADSAFPIVNGKIDPARCAAELFYVAVPSYPRKSDAVFSHPEEFDDVPSPFSVLSKLK